MDSKKPLNTRCDKINICSLAVSVISLVLAAWLFVKIEAVNRKAELMETKLENRIPRIEDDIRAKVQRMVQAVLQSNAIPTARKRTEILNVATNNLEPVASTHHHKNRRNVAQTPNAPTITLQQVRREIDKKFIQSCTDTDKICQVGPQGPPGDRGAHGYPGYKGEKGASGKTGLRGLQGPAGVQGPSGKQGPEGTQGIKGQKGVKGSVGAPGAKGNVGQMGRPGIKGSTGLKGNKGDRGAVGRQGPKGHLVVSPKIHIFPVAQKVFVNKSAIFYCWVDGHTTTKVTWRKLGGALIDEVKNGNVLHIRNVRRSDAGLYLCSVVTGYGTFRTISPLTIKEPPMFIKKPPPQVFANLGSTLTLCCKAEGSVSWTRAERSLNLLPSFQQNGCLTISVVEEESAGKYTCRATNSFGFSESTTSVIVAG